MIKQVLAALALVTVAGCAGSDYVDNVRPREDGRGTESADSGRVGALIRVARATFESGNYSAAASMYREAHQIDNGNQEALIGLGASLMRLGSYTEARDTFGAANEIEETPKALTGQAGALVAIGQAELAITQLERSLDIQETWQAHNGMGIANDMIGRHRIAQAYYRTGLEMDPRNMTMRNNLGLSLAVSGQYDKAITMLREAAGEPGVTARTRLNLALVYGLSGDYETAAEVARMDLDESAVQQNLSYYATLRALGDSKQILRALGGYASANFRKQAGSAN